MILQTYKCFRIGIHSKILYYRNALKMKNKGINYDQELMHVVLTKFGYYIYHVNALLIFYNRNALYIIFHEKCIVIYSLQDWKGLTLARITRNVMTDVYWNEWKRS